MRTVALFERLNVPIPATVKVPLRLTTESSAVTVELFDQLPRSVKVAFGETVSGLLLT